MTKLVPPSPPSNCIGSIWEPTRLPKKRKNICMVWNAGSLRDLRDDNSTSSFPEEEIRVWKGSVTCLWSHSQLRSVTCPSRGQNASHLTPSSILATTSNINESFFFRKAFIKHLLILQCAYHSERYMRIQNKSKSQLYLQNIQVT